MTAPDSFLVCNLFDHLACKGIYNTIANPEDPAQTDRFALQVKDFVRTMETMRDNIFEKIGSYVAFVTPPGYQQWPKNIQQFVYAVCDIADVRALEFSLIGSNIRVDRDSLRPGELRI